MEEAARGHAAIAAAVEQAGLRIPLTQASADSSALLQQLRSATAVLKDMQRLASSHFPMVLSTHLLGCIIALAYTLPSPSYSSSCFSDSLPRPSSWVRIGRSWDGWRRPRRRS
jgi:hypothetical protein